MYENCVKLNHEEAPDGLVEEKNILLSDVTFIHISDTLPESSDISTFLNIGIFDICDPSRKKVRVGWTTSFYEKIRLKVNVASRKNITSTRVVKRRLTYYKTGSKAFYMLMLSAARLSNILYDIKCGFFNVCK